jgi:membrane-bound lytic murein transglycosylase B
MLTLTCLKHLFLKQLNRYVLLLISALLLFSSPAPAQERDPDFASWLKLLRAEALAAGVSQQTLDEALAGLKAPEPKVIAHDKKQPEKKSTLQAYVATRVNQERIANGRVMLERYATELDRIERQYRVQKRFIVALWGLESSYGKGTGKHSVIAALVTLAYDERRSHYFRKELLEALKILDAGVVSLAGMTGSWAGAMGPFQFMPTSYRHYGVDGDGDGRIDIWGSVPDALASAANYLAKARWKGDQTWGRPVKLPEKFNTALSGLSTRLPLSRWQELGVRRSNGQPLPQANMMSSLIIPDGKNGPAYLVYGNFRALLRWNRSNSFAVSVGTLADSF